jgi:hypothetical protein
MTVDEIRAALYEAEALLKRYREATATHLHMQMHEILARPEDPLALALKQRDEEKKNAEYWREKYNDVCARNEAFVEKEIAIRDQLEAWRLRGVVLKALADNGIEERYSVEGARERAQAFQEARIAILHILNPKQE